MSTQKMTVAESENGITNIRICGKVNADNAAELDSELFAAIKDSESVVLDLEELTYISSAGLRVLLKVKKSVRELLCENVSSDVYEIFEMTGFSQIMNIRRKRRHISSEGCEEIARGAMGVVYRLDRDTILKVFDASVPVESLYQTQDTLKKLFIHDIPCAIPFDIVDVGECHGCIYEMIDMDTLAQYITKHPDEAAECGGKAAEFLKTLHRGELPRGLLPDAKDVLYSWLEELKEYLSEEDTAALKLIISGFKDRTNLLHLDFHTKNIMIRDNELMLIDLDDACIGDPLIDIGCMLMTMGVNHWGDDLCRRFIGITAAQKESYAAAFMKAYFDNCSEEEIADILKSLQPIMALRSLLARSRNNTFPADVKKRRIGEAVEMLHAAL